MKMAQDSRAGRRVGPLRHMGKAESRILFVGEFVGLSHMLVTTVVAHWEVEVCALSKSKAHRGCS